MKAAGRWKWVLLFLVVLLGGYGMVHLAYPYHYAQSIRNVSEKQDVDALLVAAIIRTESFFRADAVSKSGAQGLMQIMEPTAKWFNEKRGMPYEPEWLLDPQYNIDTGCAYYHYLLKKFGDPQLALVAWNAGEGNLTRWMAEGRIGGGNWDIPYDETRKFVEKVNHAYTMYQWIYGR